MSARGKNIIGLHIQGFCNLSDKPINILLLCFYRIPTFQILTCPLEHLLNKFAIAKDTFIAFHSKRLPSKRPHRRPPAGNAYQPSTN
jgi:hypothetical protein